MAETPAAPEIPEISFEEIQEGIKNGNVVLVDVRGREELQDQGQIANSTNIPLPELQDLLQMLTEDEFMTRFGFSLINNNSNGDKILAFSCRSGKRAQAAIEGIYARVTKELEKNGQPTDVPIRPDIRLYRGSFLDWVEKGGELTKPKA
jgi:rhodanese-related sulfurtransferase